MATENQKSAFNIRTKLIKEKKPVIMGEVMKEAGYSNRTSEHPGVLTASKGWEELKKTLNEDAAIKTFNDLVSDKNEDKRTRMDAAKEILKINDRYPAQKSKIIGLFDKLDELDDKPDQTPKSDKLDTP